MAIKIITIEKDQLQRDGVVQSIFREIEILEGLKHDNILRFMDLFVHGDFIFIVTEFMEMNLLEYINIYRDKLSEQDLIKIVNQIANALNYCHERKLVHMDVKPENVLLNVGQDGKIKDLRLADFGLSSDLLDKEHQKIGGSLGYMAPELFSMDLSTTSSLELNERLDSYSLGVLIYNLVCGQMPPKSNKMGVSAQGRRCTRRFNETAWKQCSSHLVDLT